MSAIEKEIMEIQSNYILIMDDIKNALSISNIEFKVVNPEEIKAQASQRDIAKIICQLPIKRKDIPIIIDIIGTKRATYIRKK